MKFYEYLVHTVSATDDELTKTLNRYAADRYPPVNIYQAISALCHVPSRLKIGDRPSSETLQVTIVFKRVKAKASKSVVATKRRK